MSRELLKEVFRNSYDALEAASGEEALEILMEMGSEISVMTLDIVLPKLSGIGLLKKIKTYPKLADIPVVAVSSIDDVDSIVTVLDAGAYDIINKPFDVRIVSQRVKNAVMYSEMTQMKIENAHLRELNEEGVRRKKSFDSMLGVVLLVEMKEEPEICFMNEHAKQYLAQSKETGSLYDKVRKAIHPQDQAMYKQSILETVNTGEASFFVCRVLDVNGHVRWNNVNISRAEYPEYENPIVVIHMTDITAQKQAEQKLMYKAEHDQLTGLYKRDAFFEYTEQMLMSASAIDFNMVRVNIEDFKLVNDMFGISGGDSVLIAVADALRASIADMGTFGRLQGDDFVACVERESFKPQRMLRIIHEHIDRLKLHGSIEVSLGIYEIDDTMIHVGTMCDRAKIALDMIRGDYSRKYAYYDSKLREKIIEEREFLQIFDSAVENEEFKVFLQPIYSLTSRKPVTAEALVRWINPERGFIGPNRFIPVFEKNGRIEALDMYMLEHVAMYLSRTIRMKKKANPISVNVSRNTLYNFAFPGKLLEIVKKYDVPASLIAVEITEGLYIDNPEQLKNAVSILKDNGFKIYMDDFGSGYSSLNMLKELDVDVLKIDMDFLGGFETSERAGSILTSVVRMAKWLNLKVIAEGVETDAQVDFLKSIGCDNIQGYYFSKPLPLAEYDSLIQKDAIFDAEPESFIWEKPDTKMLFNGNPIVSRLMNATSGALGIYELSNDVLEPIRVNDAYFELLGYNVSTLHSDAQNVMKHVHPDDRDRLIDICKEAVKFAAMSGSSPTPSHEIIITRYNAENEAIKLKVRARYLAGSSEMPIVSIVFTKFENEENRAGSDISEREPDLETKLMIC